MYGGFEVGGHQRSARRARRALYDLRHTFATLLLTSGVHFVQLSKWLGHSAYADSRCRLVARLLWQRISRLDQFLCNRNSCFSLQSGNRFAPMCCDRPWPVEVGCK